MRMMRPVMSAEMSTDVFGSIFPLAVTALIGPILVILFGIAPAREAFAPFADPIIFLFIGSFIIAEALATHGLYLGHAMAQAIGGRYGLPHGALNAICLPPAMRFNAAVAPLALEVVPVETAEELARLAGYTRLRDLGVPEADLGELAEAIAVRPGARANPRPASPAEIFQLLHSIW